jgi:hypothetical protein
MVVPPALDEDVEALRLKLEAVGSGAPAGGCTPAHLKALAAAARGAAARLEEDEIRARRAPAPAPAAPASPATPAKKPARADSDSDSDEGEAAPLDADLVATLRAEGAARFKDKAYGDAAKAWGKAAKHLKAARQPDAKLSVLWPRRCSRVLGRGKRRELVDVALGRRSCFRTSPPRSSPRTSSSPRRTTRPSPSRPTCAGGRATGTGARRC